MNLVTRNTQQKETRTNKPLISDGDYEGEVIAVYEKCRKEKTGEKKPYAAIQLVFGFTDNKNKQYQEPSAMLFLELDEEGPYIKVGSQTQQFLEALTGLKDFESYAPQNLKECRAIITVKTKDVNGRKYSNITNIAKSNTQKPKNDSIKKETVAVKTDSSTVAKITREPVKETIDEFDSPTAELELNDEL
jgi:hypothetical protein